MTGSLPFSTPASKEQPLDPFLLAERGPLWLGRNVQREGSAFARLNDKKGGDMDEWPESIRRRDYPL